MGILGLWAYQGFHVLMNSVAPEFVNANPGFVETSANAVALVIAGVGRVSYSWIKPIFSK